MSIVDGCCWYSKIVKSTRVSKNRSFVVLRFLLSNFANSRPEAFIIGGFSDVAQQTRNKNVCILKLKPTKILFRYYKNLMLVLHTFFYVLSYQNTWFGPTILRETWPSPTKRGNRHHVLGRRWPLLIG